MLSKTKAKVTQGEIKLICQKQFSQEVTSFVELNDGFYNISYLVRLADDSEVVLKVAPPKDVEILTYEIDIMKAEVLFYQLSKKHTEVPVPEVFGEDFSMELIPHPYYFMSKLEGIPLNHIKNIDQDTRKDIYIQLAKILGQIHNIKGSTFGYISMEEACRDKNYFDAFMVSVKAIIDDGKAKTNEFPIPIRDLEALFNKCSHAFNEVKIPSMVHFDLWDGNIFVLEDKDGIQIEGIIDFERGFYGDPSADFAQVIGYMELDNGHEFIHTYNKYAKDKIVYNQNMAIRTCAYRLYLFLIMYVECFYRDVEGSFEPQKKWVREEIHHVFIQLENAIGV